VILKVKGAQEEPQTLRGLQALLTSVRTPRGPNPSIPLAQNNIDHPKGVNTRKTLLRFEFGTEENGILSSKGLVSTTKLSPKYKGRLKPIKPKQNNMKYMETKEKKGKK
jgi:hypothetical protein